MNCQDILLLLDDEDLTRLSSGRRRAVDAHLATCPDCARVWAAQQALHQQTAPAMPAALVDRCRAALPVQRQARSPRRSSWPVVIGGLLLAGVGAAAFVAIQRDDPGPERLAVDTVAPEEVVAGNELTEPALVSTSGLPSAAGSAVANDAATAAAGATGFTVAVAPLEQMAEDPEIIRATESIHAELLAGLRQLPGLELIELSAFERSEIDVPVPGTTGSSLSYGLNSNSRIESIGSSGSDADGYEISLELLDTRGVSAFGATGETADTVPADQIPAALTERIQAVTGAGREGADADAMAGVVNVILSNNIEGIRIDMGSSTSTLEIGSDEPLQMPWDFLFDITANGRDGRWSLNVDAWSADRHRSSFRFGGVAGDMAQDLVAMAIRQLRETLFPADAALISEVESDLVDRSLDTFARLTALRRLQSVLNRADGMRLSDAAILAAVELASGADSADDRAEAWYLLQEFQDERLLQPLSDALLYDSSDDVRHAAVRALAALDNDVARSALASAASNDPAAEIRRNAGWFALAEPARRERIVAALLNRQLSADERLQPLELAIFPPWGDTWLTGIDSLIDAGTAAELDGLIAGIEDPARRTFLLQRIDVTASSPPSFAPVLISRLHDDADSNVRAMAARLLLSRQNEPGVRPALEQAAVNDPSELVREQVQQILQLDAPPD